MRRMRRGLAVVVAIALGATSAWAGVPTEQLKSAIDAVLKVLENPALKGAARHAERRVAISMVADRAFDFDEVARRVLTRHWRGLTPAQREEFVALFKDLLEHTYISTLDLYSSEQIVYTGELSDGDYATVRTKIITKRGTEIPVDYRMLRRGDRWLIYDASVENVSYVDNYRSQFNQIIAQSSYAGLVDRMKAKLAELKGKEQAAAKRHG